MRTLRRAAAVFVVSLVAACSSESSDDNLNPQPLPPEDRGGTSTPSPPPNGGVSAGSSSCTGTCCQQPAVGSTCNSAEDSTCSWAVTCPQGLVIPYQITCSSGTWKLLAGCPNEGEVDSRGCPASQPANNTACTISPNNPQNQCGYVLECTGYRKSAIATCNGQAWQTTALGVCD
jgi:hypothetical protein